MGNLGLILKQLIRAFVYQRIIVSGMLPKKPSGFATVRVRISIVFCDASSSPRPLNQSHMPPPILSLHIFLFLCNQNLD